MTHASDYIIEVKFFVEGSTIEKISDLKKIISYQDERKAQSHGSGI